MKRLMKGAAVAAGLGVIKFWIDCSYFPWAIECWFAPMVGVSIALGALALAFCAGLRLGRAAVPARSM